MIEFLASLVKTPDKNDFLKDNCVHVTGDYWIYEGDNELLDDELSKYKIVREGIIPCLGGLSPKELIQGCIEWFGVEVMTHYDSPK